MYLKSIEVHGFKSFANKMVFEFHDGITGIVGPNGSGKSNVADAVRWVLGEQSASKLRGSRMEDVIFSGTELRKPQGLAYVAITLDNSDHKLATEYEEVTVARRVYRSGESEYLMNGASCRLKDISELFFDTGIGKEGYSIIGQGQIEKILSGKPEDRRELFDEAAGIVKYKKRKAAAEKNLEEEHQNLDRVKDILRELELQTGPLKEQSEVAKQFLEYRDQLKQYDIQSFLMEYDRIHEELQTIQEKERIAKSDLEETKDQYDATREEYEQLEQTLAEKNRSLEEKNERTGESRIQKEKLEGDLKVINEQILAGRESSAYYQERRTAMEENLQEKREQLQALKEQLEEQKTAEKEQRASLLALAEQAEELKQRLESAVRSRAEFDKEIRRSLKDDTQLKTSLQRYETMLEQSKLKKAEMNQRLLRVKSEDAALEEEAAKSSRLLQELDGKLSVCLETMEQREEELSQLSNQLLQLEKERETYAASYHREQSRLESLNNLTERYEGYGQSIRRVMEQKKSAPGIVGVVADIIKVDKAYETAIETALGGSIQNIVTEDEETAKQMIGYLKRNRFGRATFLPLTAIRTKGGISDPGVLKEPGVVGTADGLVQADVRFTPVLTYLLGRNLVVDTMDHAVSIARKYRQTLRIVTLEGELIQPGGSMSGGAFRNSSSLLGRRREMEELKRVIQNLWQHQKETDEEKERLLQEQKKKQQAVVALQQQTQQYRLEQNTERVKKEQAEESKEQHKYQLAELVRESKEAEKEAEEWREQMQKLKDSANDQENRKKEKEEKLQKLEAQAEEYRTGVQDLAKQQEALRLEISRMEQNQAFLEQNQERLFGEVSGLEAEKAELEKKEQEGLERLSQREMEIEKIRGQMEQLRELIEKTAVEMEEIRSQREAIEKSHRAFFHKREELAERMNALDKECYRLESQREKLKEDKDAKSNYMWEEYELTWKLAYERRLDTELTLSQIKKECLELKGKIRALGDVNVNAIEDYKNMSERYALLKTQHDDLAASEEVLQGIIQELDEEMRKQFLEKFEEIRIEFDKVFRELFGGGKGTVSLVEGEDILEAGISIIAQPPGKKLQNMMQLSGGEKSLTAISLLFAIQNLKPSPFCLLDEIEAALDDSNVSRFAHYLHKLTKHTQFIVITHRRGTMAAADILYGITMQEKGVSTLVSVNLVENELTE